jgi:hypothetical protein
MSDCKCGCGKQTSSERGFLSGHDQTLRIDLENRVGGIDALKALVEGFCRARELAELKESK